VKDFFKYLNASEQDKEWGMFLTVAGKYKSPPGEDYPITKHPNEYYFRWESGRVLEEYQLNYITEGHGILEVAGELYNISPGTIMIIRPGVQHRYKPKSETGWEENYIGFKGDLASHFLDYFERIYKTPMVECGIEMEVFDTYEKVFELINHQRPGFHQIASGLLLKLLGQLISIQKEKMINNQSANTLVATAKKTMWDNLEQNFDLKAFVKTQHVSYSYFRKLFKDYTGFAPHQYYLDLKIMRAREMLTTTDLSVKEITYTLGFDSVQYFSRLFKKKTGKSPTDLRA
jgi:AraC-like DNA-binding protein